MVGPRPARTRAFRVASASKVRTSAPRRHRARFVPLPAPVGFVSAGLPKRKWDGFFPVVSPEVATRNRKRRKVIHDRQRGRTPDAPFTSPLEPLWVGFTTEEVDILKAGYADKSYYGGPDYRCGRCKSGLGCQKINNGCGENGVTKLGGYIMFTLLPDEKLQKLLGHFQKDYEGGVCAENSGSQMGGYGSFLYPQCSLSVISQSRSPAVPPNHGNASRSPYVPVESAQKSHFVKTELDSRGKDDYCRRTSNGINGNPHQQILNRAVNGPEQKAPKIRIKVNSSRSLARNTAAVYSGIYEARPKLGTDTAASSCGTGNKPNQKLV